VLSWFASAIALVVGEGAEADPKTSLQERLQAAGNKAPNYVLVGSTGPDHEKEFQVEIRLPGKTLASGSGRSKKEAERNAAIAALQETREEGE